MLYGITIISAKNTESPPVLRRKQASKLNIERKKVQNKQAETQALYGYGC